MPLAKAYEIYSEATMATSGTVKTVRGPSMSATPGKVQVVGITSIKGEKVRMVPTRVSCAGAPSRCFWY